MIVATTAEVTITAAFGLAGAVVGALISSAAARSHRRQDKDDQVRDEALKVTLALEALMTFGRAAQSQRGTDDEVPDDGGQASLAVEALRAEATAERVRLARHAFNRLALAAIAAGVDSELAWGSNHYAGELIQNNPDLDGERRAANAQGIVEYAVGLMFAVSVPYWRRKGPFMHPELKKRAYDIAVLDEEFGRIEDQNEA
jgi:hypothetical protein